MSAIDLDARARAWYAQELAEQPSDCACYEMHIAALVAMLRAVALEVGDAVQAAHRERYFRVSDPRTCAACCGDGTSDESTATCPAASARCHDCGGTGVADAAIVLGITRPR